MQVTSIPYVFFQNSANLSKSYNKDWSEIEDNRLNEVVLGPDNKRYIHQSTREKDAPKTIYKVIKFFLNFLKFLPFPKTLGKIEDYNTTHFRKKIVQRCVVLDPTEDIDNRFNYKNFCNLYEQAILSRCTGQQLTIAQEGFHAHLKELGAVKVLKDPSIYCEESKVLGLDESAITSRLIKYVNDDFASLSWEKFVNSHGLESLVYVSDELKMQKKEMLIQLIDSELQKNGFAALQQFSSMINEFNAFGLIDILKNKIKDYITQVPPQVLKEQSIGIENFDFKARIQGKESTSFEEINLIDVPTQKVITDYCKKFLDLETEQTLADQENEKELKKSLDSLAISEQEYMAKAKEELGLDDFDIIEQKVHQAQENMAKYNERQIKNNNSIKLLNQVNVQKIENSKTPHMTQLTPNKDDILSQLKELNLSMEKNIKTLRKNFNTDVLSDYVLMNAKAVISLHETKLNEYYTKLNPKKEFCEKQHNALRAKALQEFEQAKASVEAIYSLKKTQLIEEFNAGIKTLSA